MVMLYWKLGSLALPYGALYIYISCSNYFNLFIIKELKLYLKTLA